MYAKRLERIVAQLFQNRAGGNVVSRVCSSRELVEKFIRVVKIGETREYASIHVK